MSAYTTLMMWQTCRDLSDINRAIIEKDPNWTGLTYAAQITSISWNQAEGVWYVFWPVRSWTGVEE